MRYRSTSSADAPWSTFSEAVLAGIAPDGGLYVPESIPALSSQVRNSLHHLSFEDAALELIQPFCVDEIEGSELRAILNRALSFPAPLKQLTKHVFVLELFHGPTLAFKDFGARFMAGVMGTLVKKTPKSLHILVATSGDTGGAVANAFLGIPGISVHILFPAQRISALQELQLTTLGENIHAYEVLGSFDDCQRLVMESFVNSALKQKGTLASANSINIARLLPQSFYYVEAHKQLVAMGHNNAPLFVVPSGNLGNVCGGIIASKLAIPGAQFVVACNANDVLPQFLTSGIFTPRPSVATLSNAMDVGNPSNFVRLQYLLGLTAEEMRPIIRGQHVSDLETQQAITTTWRDQQYLLDPHTAVGVCATKKLGLIEEDRPIVVLATAHPAKFPDVYPSLGIAPAPIHPQLEEIRKRKGVKTEIKPTLDSLASALRF